MIPLVALGGFLVLMALMLLLAVRRSRRGFEWSDGDGGFTADEES